MEGEVGVGVIAWAGNMLFLGYCKVLCATVFTIVWECYFLTDFLLCKFS